MQTDSERFVRRHRIVKAARLLIIATDAKSVFLLEIIDGRELPEYMTMNKGKICG